MINPAEYGAFAMSVGYVKDPKKVSPGDPVYKVPAVVVVDRSLMK